MDNDSARIRLKVGMIEIEYEGKASFLQDDLANLLERVIDLYETNKESISADEAPALPDGSYQAMKTPPANHSTNTIAAHLGANTGPELAVAAAAHLSFVAKKETFTRRDILDEMKGATTYYNANMSGNLSKILTTLTKAKRLNQIKAGVYALSAGEKSGLGAKLAQFG